MGCLTKIWESACFFTESFTGAAFQRFTIQKKAVTVHIQELFVQWV